jgi:hypothetical protein
MRPGEDVVTDFDKIRQFNGKIASKWQPPDSYRRWAAGANKLLKLYYRMRNSGLLWPELIDQLKKATDAWQQVGDIRYKNQVDPQYYIEFSEIQKFDVVNYLTFQKNIIKLLGEDKGQTFTEETRDSTPGTRCHFCRTALVKPSYIVHRVGPEIVHKSDPIGIQCLHAYTGKLKKLVEMPELANLLATAVAA